VENSAESFAPVNQKKRGAANYMKALIFQGVRDVVVAEIDEPTPPGPSEVLLAPLYNGICSTDKHFYEGLPSGDRTRFALPVPGQVIGHEFSATVLEVGSDVTHLRQGMRVAVDPGTRCGLCLMCQAGLHWQCTGGRGVIGLRSAVRPDGTRYLGGTAERCVVPSYTCYEVPIDVSDLRAANVEPLCCGTRAIRHSGIAIGDNVVFLGGEEYNLAALQWARLAGAQSIIVVDPLEVRRSMAMDLGATYVINPETTDVVRDLHDLLPFGADLAFLSIESYVPASHRYLDQALDIARVQGTIVITRIYGNDAFQMVSDPRVGWVKELTIRQFGLFFGEEPWRGGRARSDYAVTIAQLAKGGIAEQQWRPKIVALADIKSKADVDDLFGSLPAKVAKVILRIGAT
jgi:(R,R)-butanediol dehydrogenase/meso-butanediol dehydrogenase/diacetyl reductase